MGKEQVAIIAEEIGGVGSGGEISIVEKPISLKGHEGTVWGVSWHPLGKILASCGQDQIIRLWKWVDSQWVLTDKLCDAHKRTIRTVAFSPDGKRLAAAGFDGAVSIWVSSLEGSNSSNSSGDGQEPQKVWKCAANLEGHENEVKNVSWSSDGKLLATCGRDKTVWIWEVNPNDEDDSIKSDDLDFECLAVLSEHSQDVKAVQFNPFDSRMLVSASYDDTIKIWASSYEHDDEWTCRQTFNEHKSTVWSARFSPLGNFIVSVGDDRRIIIFKRSSSSTTLNTTSYQVVSTLEDAHYRPIIALDVAPCCNTIPSLEDEAANDDDDKVSFTFATSGDRKIKFWKYDSVNCKIESLGTFAPAERLYFNDIRWNPLDPSLLAVAGDDGVLKIIRIEKKYCK